jgi:hypothetical protein
MNFSLLIWQHQICNELDADSKKKKKKKFKISAVIVKLKDIKRVF